MMAVPEARLLRYLQGWVGVVGLIAIGNTVGCFRNHVYLSERIYTEQPDEVNALSGRLFGVWTLLAGILRLCCALNIQNLAIYNMTLVSFILAFFHFITEVTIYKTASIESFGVISPLIISGMTALWMVAGYWCMDEKESSDNTNYKRDFDELKLRKKSKKV